MDHPCVRSMVRRRRVGGGARSREISHRMIGSIPAKKLNLNYFYLGKMAMDGVPHIPQSVRASPMTLTSLASLGVRALVGSLRRPTRCWRRALACKMWINTLAPYWISLTSRLSVTEVMCSSTTTGHYHG